MIVLFITLLLTPLGQKLVDFTPQLVFKISSEIDFRSFTSKLIKIKFLNEIQTLIVEYIINQFFLTMYQKKLKEWGYDILKISRF